MNWCDIITSSKQTPEERTTAEYIGKMMDVFEDALDQFNMKLIEPDVPSKDTETASDSLGSAVNLKGSNYDELADRICRYLDRKDGIARLRNAESFYGVQDILKMLSRDITDIFRDYAEQMSMPGSPDIADYDLHAEMRAIMDILFSWREDRSGQDQ